MKLGDDVLIAIMAALRKGLMENTDISDLLRQLDLVNDGDRLKLNPLQNDIWTSKEV